MLSTSKGMKLLHRITVALGVGVLAPVSATAEDRGAPDGAARGMRGTIFADAAALRVQRPQEASRACDLWATAAAERHGVPLDLMLAITRVETGLERAGAVRPWPWAINAGGEGIWLPTRDAATAFARAWHRENGDAIDLGCFQLNLGWHGRAFESLEAMLDPSRNADYAARFLSELRKELGSWRAAAAAFHSRTPERGAAYLARIDAVLAGQGALPEPRDGTGPRTPRPPAQAPNLRRTPGSVFPVDRSRTMPAFITLNSATGSP